MIKRNGDNVFAIASSNNQCQGARGASVSLCPSGGGAATRIPRATTVRMTPPDAHHNTKEANIALSTYVEKWKNRYEDAERKHKTYLLKSEKAKREYDDLQRRHNIVLEERNHLDCELRERERELAKLKAVSEKLFKEYQQLKNQHEVDAGVMNKVMAQAGEWYKQNKQLKRRSTALLQALPATPVDIDFTDSNDAASDASSNEEVEFLKQTVSELSRQVAALQTDLNAARLQEFEAQEANVALAQELEASQARCSSLQGEVTDARAQLERHHRVSKLLMDEVTALKDHADNDRQMAETYKTEARAAKKRVKLLTHQSALLMGELELDERLMTLLTEVDSLKEALEEQDQRHRDHLEELQLKLAEKHEDTDILLWEEKIKLAEEDAQKALERAERAERKLYEAERKAKEAERKLTQAEQLITSTDQKLTETEIKLGETGTKLIETETKQTPNVQKLVETDTKLTETAVKLTETQKRLEDKRPKKSNLMSRISYFESGANEKKEERREASLPKDEVKEEVLEEQEMITQTACREPPPPASPPGPAAPPPPPPPPACPPPPPPPPPPPVFRPAGGDMATMLANKQGTLKRTKQNGEAQGGAIDAIVDQIKGGKFHLKSANQHFLEKKPREEQPEAVKEMLAILGTLRKRRSVHRPSYVASET